MNIVQERYNDIIIITINRTDVRNAIDRPTAEELSEAFRQFDADNNLKVAILTGAGGNFCAGADLLAIAEDGHRKNKLNPNMKEDGPLGPTRMLLSKPVIAAVSGYAVAGGLELACWCDIRMADSTAKFGVFCRRFGVPLIDGGTQRLPRLIGLSRALDMIITGKEIDAEEAYQYGLVNYLVKDKDIKDAAIELAQKIASYPQICMQSDRMLAYRGIHMPLADALEMEFAKGTDVIRSGETLEGARKFAASKGKNFSN
ncbi:MAG: crotonase/enoyl-CoA hydratase family protein [Spirochaetota bacterium]